MRAIGKGRITTDSGAAENVLPERHAQRVRDHQGEQDEGHGPHFCERRQDVELWLQAAPRSICRSGR